ncbi:hypothetical protein [Salmonella phage SD-2_S15]|nr:hypothetical protein [Salmonella phage SD-2_S15]WPK19162.1 hypothetical protein [Salmonella phage SD-6_S16]
MQVLSTNTFKIVFFLYRGTIIQYYYSVLNQSRGTIFLYRSTIIQY